MRLGSCLSVVSASVRTPAESDLHREMIPILIELLTLESWRSDHPTVKYLYNHLVDQLCTGEEFCYIIEPLHKHVEDIMNNNFKSYVYDTYNGVFKKVNSHLGRVAAEAIAIKCPILEGPWEHVAWLIVEENIGY